jgi:hypothetical protein
MQLDRCIVSYYAVRSMYHVSNINTLKSIYFAYFQFIIKYGIIFWGNSSNSKKIFTLQKKIIRIMVGALPRAPCRSLFKKLEIVPIPCQYILSLMNFILNNQEHCQTNSSIHSTDTAISTTCIDQMPTYLVFKKVQSMPVSQFSTDSL